MSDEEQPRPEPIGMTPELQRVFDMLAEAFERSIPKEQLDR